MAVTSVFAALVMLGQLLPLPATLAFWSNPVILEFVLGMLIAAAFRAGYRFSSSLSCALIVAGIVAYLPTIQAHATELSRVVTWGGPASCILAGLVFIKNPNNGRISDVISLLGNASYALYLVHPFIFVLPRRFFPDIVASVSSPLLFGMLLLSCSVAAAIFVHLVIEKPTTRMLRKAISGLSKRHVISAPTGVQDTIPATSTQIRTPRGRADAA